jgi:hypothetical protein
METWGGWQSGPGGQETPPGALGQVIYLDTAPLRRAARFVMWSALAVFAGVVAIAALIAAVIPHIVLVVLLIAFGVPLLLLAIATAIMVWIARRAWRSGAWLEAAGTAAGAAAGAPWLSRLALALRALLVGKALHRFGQRVRHPRGGPRNAPGGYAQYQAHPDGPWQQAQTGGFSGTK